MHLKNCFIKKIFWEILRESTFIFVFKPDNSYEHYNEKPKRPGTSLPDMLSSFLSLVIHHLAKLYSRLLSYWKNYNWYFMQVISQQYSYFIFNFLLRTWAACMESVKYLKIHFRATLLRIIFSCLHSQT